MYCLCFSMSNYPGLSDAECYKNLSQTLERLAIILNNFEVAQKDIVTEYGVMSYPLEYDSIYMSVNIVDTDTSEFVISPLEYLDFNNGVWKVKNV